MNRGEKLREVKRLREELVIAEAKLDEFEEWSQQVGGALGVKRLRNAAAAVLAAREECASLDAICNLDESLRELSAAYEGI